MATAEPYEPSAEAIWAHIQSWPAGDYPALVADTLRARRELIDLHESSHASSH